jgi:hypothetical protein
MNPAKVTAEDYIQFTLATPKVVSATEAARVSTTKDNPPAHDAFRRLLMRLEPTSDDLWSEVQPLIRRHEGVLIIDDSTLDKPYAQFMPLVGSHWSGKHHRVVHGINLVTTLWSDGSCFYPCDYRIYRKTLDQKTKNDHFRDMLQVAHERGFTPRYVLFDSWYASLDNLKYLNDLNWKFLTRFKANRLVRINHGQPQALEEQAISATGTVVWVPGYGELKVFRFVAPNGDTSYWVSNDLDLTSDQRAVVAQWSWNVEEYHRGLKQYTGVERCAMRLIRGQRNHIGLALRAFVRLEYHRVKAGLSWFQAKTEICRQAIRQYLLNPLYQLPQTATA